MQPETVAERILVQPSGENQRPVKWNIILIVSNLFVITGLIIVGLIWAIQKGPDSPVVHQVEVKKIAVDKPQIRQLDERSIGIIENISQPALKGNRSAPKSPTIGELAVKNKTKENSLPSQEIVHNSENTVKLPNVPVIKDNKQVIAKKNDPIMPLQPIAPPKSEPVINEVKTTENAPINDNKLPFLRDMPDEFRQLVPKMKINVYAYSQNPSERFVIINLIKYKTGQQTQDAVEIKEINPNSLVVKYRDQSFKIEP